MPDQVRYGLISTARIGFSAHVPAAKTSPNSVITAVSSRNLATAEEKAKEHGIPHAFGSYQEMIDSDEIDAVINTLPNSMHHEWSVKAAQAGKHVLCEKPLTATMDEAKDLKRVCEENNVVLVEAFTPRFNKQMRTARQLIADGEIGDVIRINAGLSFFLTNPDDIRLSKELAGGSMMDAGCYAVYATRYTMSAEPVTAMALDRKSNGQVDTTFSGFMQFPNGAVGYVWSSVEGPRESSYEAIGTKGKIVIPQSASETAPVIVTRGDKEETLEMESVNRYQVQLDEFSECVLNGKAPEFPADDALRQMAALLALYESVDTGKAAKVEVI